MPIVCGYDEVNYDESVYDSCGAGATLDVPLAFGWGVSSVPVVTDTPAEICMSFTMRVADAAGDLVSSVDFLDRVTLPEGQFQNAFFVVPSTGVDVPFPVAANNADVLFILPQEDIVVKLNDSTGTAMPIRKGGMLMLHSTGLTGLLISNFTVNDANVRVVSAVD